MTIEPDLVHTVDRLCDSAQEFLGIDRLEERYRSA